MDDHWGPHPPISSGKLHPRSAGEIAAVGEARPRARENGGAHDDGRRLRHLIFSKIWSFQWLEVMVIIACWGRLGCNPTYRIIQIHMYTQINIYYIYIYLCIICIYVK